LISKDSHANRGSPHMFYITSCDIRKSTQAAFF